jgi:hypothetical protein
MPTLQFLFFFDLNPATILPKTSKHSKTRVIDQGKNKETQRKLNKHKQARKLKNSEKLLET